MKVLVAALTSLALLTLPARAAPQAAPPAPIVALARTIVDAANANDATKLAGKFTDDAVVIDEDAPFVWRGPDAGVAWWHAVQRAIAAKHATLHAVARPPSEYRRSGVRAYLIQPVEIVKSAGGKTITEYGTQTYTFQLAGGAWKISSAVWTTKP
ncbi:MAG: DUF4440 domain-containing protein [bacterium]|nr:DUF4440 domain-containing protein [bacterium]